MSKYWHPKFKYQLVELFVIQGIWSYRKAMRMSKRQLYGKYTEERRKEVRNAEASVCRV
jgi:hypothetical protein